MITVDAITRKYGDFTAVDNVSFAISPGEVVGLLGHNGAGKTTIMKMMTGYLEPTSGSVKINGIDIAHDRQRIQRDIGYLPENCPVYPEMTIVDFLDYAATLQGVSSAEKTALVADAIKRTGLTEKAVWPIAKLSRGYRQRTGVAQAILHKPGILILDEPTNGLDPTQIQQMRQLIGELARESTIIISTHILQEVQAVCDRVIIMKDGTKALDTRLADLQSSSRLLLTTDVPAAQARPVLAAIDGIADVSSLQVSGNSDTTYALTVQEADDRKKAIAMVAAKVHEQGWPLYGLQMEARTLETVFAEISAQ